ncbi:MAG: acyl-CoA dehydrogenase family protein [Gammaproteobacteria bacterium]|nr:acyl-CoA dehydrogenase family protein [Gammaproteobacteria bacterium]
MASTVDVENVPEVTGYMTEERRMIQEVARDFTRKEVLPVANELDPVQGDIPMDLRNKMGEMGYFGIRTPEEYGGMGLGVFEYCLVAEELARGWMSVASIIARAGGVMGVQGWPLEKRIELTKKAARGEYLAAVSLSEPGAGSDLAAVSCRAVLDGDEWVITGNKYWCTFADGADYISLLARVEAPGEDDARYSGMRSFIIEKARGELPEGCNGAPIPKIGYFGWKTWELAFDGCRIPRENIVGGSNVEGFKSTVSGLNSARAHTAARAIGLARGALEDAMAYAQERVQFGVPISDFQETRFKIARMASEIEAARQLMYYVCTEMDSGRRCDKEAAMVKWFASEMAERVTSNALQIFGGAGYTKLHAVERYWRDARLTKIFEGTSEIQLRIISDRLMGRPSHRATA